MGMPDPNIKWSKNEYGQALSILRSQKLYGSLLMPRKFSRKSGAVFKRLVSEENISFVNDTSITTMDKAYLIQHFANFQEGMIGLYTYQVKDPRYYRNELIDIFIFGIAINNAMLDLAEKLSKSENKDEKMMSANSSVVYKHYSNLIFKIFDEQTRSDIYKKRDLKRLSSGICESLSKNWNKLNFTERTEINLKVRQIVNILTLQAVKKKYETILNFPVN